MNEVIKIYKIIEQDKQGYMAVTIAMFSKVNRDNIKTFQDLSDYKKDFKLIKYYGDDIEDDFPVLENPNCKGFSCKVINSKSEFQIYIKSYFVERDLSPIYLSNSNFKIDLPWIYFNDKPLIHWYPRFETDIKAENFSVDSDDILSYSHFEPVYLLVEGTKRHLKENIYERFRINGNNGVAILDLGFIKDLQYLQFSYEFDKKWTLIDKSVQTILGFKRGD